MRSPFDVIEQPYYSGSSSLPPSTTDGNRFSSASGHWLMWLFSFIISIIPLVFIPAYHWSAGRTGLGFTLEFLGNIELIIISIPLALAASFELTSSNKKKTLSLSIRLFLVVVALAGVGLYAVFSLSRDLNPDTFDKARHLLINNENWLFSQP